MPVKVGLSIGAFKANEFVTSVVFAFSAKPGTVGAAAVPPKSPANWTLPLAVVVASGAPAAKLVVTNSVVAICVVLVPNVAVGANGVPVNVGEAEGAFKFNAV